ncbi:YfgM family protein [Persicimonas caeni]|nr:tetratricopeptide repeat protein [Persicimonas caeni]
MAIKIRKRTDGEEPEAEAPEGQAGAPAASDPVLEATMRGASWVEQNRNLVIGGVIAAVVAIIGVWVGTAYIEGQEVKASSTLSPALWDYAAPVEGSEELDLIKQAEEVDPPAEVFASETERWQAIYDKADKSLSAKGSGALAQTARLTKAAAANRLGKPDEAVELYKAYLGGETDEAMLPVVYLGLATAHSAKGNVDEAAANFDKLVEVDASYEGLAMYQKAQVLEAAGKTDKAKELYHEILESDPETPYRDEIERRLALL